MGQRTSRTFMHSTSDAPRPFVNRQCSEERMKNLIVRFIREEQGQDLIEYGLLIAIITTGAITAIGLIGPKVQGYFETLEAALP
jgi:pilus assembly protein Flp/PilA